MNEPFAFFDVDCLEKSDDGKGLQLRPRVKPLQDKLDQIYKMAEFLNIPLLFSTCCSGQMLNPGDLQDILFIPCDKNDTSWMSDVHHYRRFYIEKKAYGDPKVNFKCRAFDMFQDNGNILRLLKLLNIPDWVVFGNGMDLCVNCGATGVLSAGYNVTILSDVLISSAGGDGQSMKSTLDGLKSKGAKTQTFQNMMDALNKSAAVA